MLKMYHLPFGDWKNCRLGSYKVIDVICEDKDTFKKAEDRIKEKYGECFFSGMADFYDEDNISGEVKKALWDTNFTAEQFLDNIDGYDMEGVKTLDECFLICDHLNIEVIIEMYLHLVRAFGAEFEVVEDIEMITNVAAPGYGCII